MLGQPAGWLASQKTENELHQSGVELSSNGDSQSAASKELSCTLEASYRLVSSDLFTDSFCADSNLNGGVLHWAQIGPVRLADAFCLEDQIEAGKEMQAVRALEE